MASDYEKIFTNDLYLKLKDDLNLTNIPTLLKNLEIRKNQKIIYDITIMFGANGVFSPKFGFLEQDLAIGIPLKVPEHLEQYCYRIKDKSSVFEPELIIEIKYGNVTSHQLMTYSNIASKIKAVFPRCRYYLVLGYCSVNIFEKLMRHGTNFDKIYNLFARTTKETKIPNYYCGKLLDDYKNHSKKKVYDSFLKNIKYDLAQLKILWY